MTAFFKDIVFSAGRAKVRGHREGDIYLHGEDVYHYSGDRWVYVSVDYAGKNKPARKAWDLYIAQEPLKKLAEFLD